MAREVLMVKSDEFNSLVQYYKGKISDNAVLNKAGRVAAEAHVLLSDSDVPDGIANVRVKELLRHRRALSKRLREIPGVAPPGGEAPPLEEEEGVLTKRIMDNLLKEIAKNTARKAPRPAVVVVRNGGPVGDAGAAGDGQRPPKRKPKYIPKRKIAFKPKVPKKPKGVVGEWLLPDVGDISSPSSPPSPPFPFSLPPSPLPSTPRPRSSSVGETPKKATAATPMWQKPETPFKRSISTPDTIKDSELLGEMLQPFAESLWEKKEIGPKVQRRKTWKEKDCIETGKLSSYTMARNAKAGQSRRKRRRGRRRQGGEGVDTRKLLRKTGIEFHMPGYQYLVPGTHLKKRLARGDAGINRLDRIAKQHDIDYSKAAHLRDKWKADDKMIKAINRLPGKKSFTEKIVKKMMQTKKKLGL